MKQTLLFIFIFVIAASAQAAGKNTFVNTQFHYDFHREITTSTLEVFHIDRLGNTFFFVDFDFDKIGQHGSYFEIAHNFRIAKTAPGNLNLSVQYNDGVLEAPAKIIPGVFLYGIALDNVRIGKAWLEFQALARKEFPAELSWQFTFVWLAPVKPWLAFNGYVDVNSDRLNDGRTRVQAEPQLKFLWRQWAIGSEVEVSWNFVPAGTDHQPFEENTWFTHPTIFLQYNF